MGTGTVGARIAGIATHLPERILGNEELAALHPTWSTAKIAEKTGIVERRIAADDETALDLAVAACRKLSERIDLGQVDFLILCTQAPDYILPTTACLLQDRLGLSTATGALDVNLGCSGFVYGLSLASGLIASGAATKVLLVTSDTYSKYIHPKDKSVRTLFGDGAAATLIVADDDGASIGPFVFGTDGAGAERLIVKAGGFRTPRSAETAIETTDKAGNTRSLEHLFMDGAAVMNFSLKVVPRTLLEVLDKGGVGIDDVDHFVLHQANKFMLDALQKRMSLPAGKVPRLYEQVGNTVSSTIPFVLEAMVSDGQMSAGKRMVLIGFGVGLSWAAAMITC